VLTAAVALVCCVLLIQLTSSLSVIFVSGHLNIVYLIMLRKVSLYRHLFYSSNDVFSDVFRVYDTIRDAILTCVRKPT